MKKLSERTKREMDAGRRGRRWLEIEERFGKRCVVTYSMDGLTKYVWVDGAEYISEPAAAFPSERLVSLLMLAL